MSRAGVCAGKDTFIGSVRQRGQSPISFTRKINGEYASRRPLPQKNSKQTGPQHSSTGTPLLTAAHNDSLSQRRRTLPQRQQRPEAEATDPEFKQLHDTRNRVSTTVILILFFLREKSQLFLISPLYCKWLSPFVCFRTVLEPVF